MALQKTTAYFPFAQGVDSKTDPKQVVAGKLLTLQNGYFQTPGMIRKRPGFVQLGTNGLGSGTGVATFKNELVSTGGSGLSTFSPTSSAGITRGNYVPITMQTWSANIVTVGGLVDMAYHSAGYYAVSSYQNGGIYDAKTQTLIAAAGVNGVQTKVFALGNFFVFIGSSGSGITYYAYDVTSGTPSIGTIDGATSNQVFDACLIAGTLYIAYGNGAGVSLRSVSPTLTVSAATTVASVPYASLTIYPGGPTGANAEVHVACSDQSSTIKIFAYKTNLTTQTLAPIVLTSLPGSTSVTMTGFAAVGGASGSGTLYFTVNGHVWSGTYTSGGGTGTGLFAANSMIASKVFNVSGTSGYFFVQNVSTSISGLPEQPTRFLVRTNGRSNSYTLCPALKLAPETAYQMGAPWPYPPAEVCAAGTGFLHSFLQLSSDPTYTIQVVQFSFSGAPGAVEIGNNLHLSGGCLWMYDGQQAVEHGYHVYPEITGTLGSGGGLSSGSYQWVAVYEWTDAQGNVHRSAPSLPVTLTAVSGQKATISIPPLVFTAKPLGLSNGQCNVVVYRTQANGTVFYRLSGSDATPFPSGWTVPAGTYSDTGSDANIAGNPQLYTTGGEVENYATPAILSMTTYKSRLCAIPADNPYQFWFSKQVLPGSPVEMSLFFTQSFDAKGGPGTALIAMDDKLVVFKQSAIFAIVGDGPSPNGANNDFTTGQLVATDVGTTNPASVVLTPLGIMFQSAKGISLLDRALSTENYIGKDVEAYVQGTTVLSAVLYPSFNQVRFQLSSGTTLVYDYLVGQWSPFTNPAGVQAVIWQNAYTYVTSSGALLQESASVFTDAGAFYALQVQTSWLSFAGIQGFQRVREVQILGDWKSAHTLQVQVAYDFVQAPTQTTQISASTSVSPYQFRVLFDRQKCEALSLTIQDTQTAPYGEGMDLSGLAFELGVKGGLSRVSQSQTNR